MAWKFCIVTALVFVLALVAMTGYAYYFRAEPKAPRIGTYYGRRVMDAPKKPRKPASAPRAR